jgi:hypothetical protein
VLARWGLSATLPALVPGGLLYGLRQPPMLRPFASMGIGLAGDPEYTTGLHYVQSYNLGIRVWADDKLNTAGDIQVGLEKLLPCNTKLAMLDDNAWTLHISLQPPTSAGNQLVLAEVEQLPERLFGKFVLTAAASWLIQLQENRS